MKPYMIARKHRSANSTPSAPWASMPCVEPVIAAIVRSPLCCDCLARVTGCSGLSVRRSLIAVSRLMPLNTWTPCDSCGAVEETYGIERKPESDAP
jgi:hypothetical protein